MIGKIIKLTGGFYYIYSEGEIHTSRARGLFRHHEVSPVVGDEVEFETEGDLSYIKRILPRKNILVRPPVANIDQVMILVPVAKPQYNLQLTDSVISSYENNNLNIIMCINKVDLDRDAAEKLYKIYEKAVAHVILTSFTTGEGTEEVREVLKHKLTALSGVSGAGKSTLTSFILGKEIERGEVSRKTERGKHTTRHVELHNVGDTFIFDTPGFSSINLDQIEIEKLPYLFHEFIEYLPCRFNNCMHINEPGCKIKEKVEEGIIPKSRYESYLQLHAEILEKGRY